MSELAGERRVSLFEHAGGAPAFQALAAALHERCLADPVLNHPFGHPGQHPEHVQRLGTYLAEVFGGPPAYSQTCGTHFGMLDLHARSGADDDLGERFVRCFVLACDDAGLPAEPEFRAALREYMTWAAADVMRYSQPGSQVPAGVTMPHWTWDGPR
ncbi:oxidoreductase [Dactylosporangium sp. NPDC000521]|uniref:globin domain-containing protein n=1 Tax=Dactylosporangium sp. NPDC000521 TaxID=3363975 RepID=UPI00368A9C83